MLTINPFARLYLLLAAVLLLIGFALPAITYAQDGTITTKVEMPKKAINQLQEREKLDAEAILGMLNEGLFALECASPKKMRAIILFLSEDGVMRVAGDPVELASGRHAAKGVMPGDRVSEAWTEMTSGEGMRPDPTDAHFPETVFNAEEEIAESMRDEMEIGDGRVGLIMFLTLADEEMRQEMGERLQIRPMGLAFNVDK